MHGTRNNYRLVEQDDYLLVDGLHEGIVFEELWHEAQVKLLVQAEKYEHVNRGKDTNSGFQSFAEDMSLSLDKDAHMERVALLTPQA